MPNRTRQVPQLVLHGHFGLLSLKVLGLPCLGRRSEHVPPRDSLPANLSLLAHVDLVVHTWLRAGVAPKHRTVHSRRLRRVGALHSCALQNPIRVVRLVQDVRAVRQRVVLQTREAVVLNQSALELVENAVHDLESAAAVLLVKPHQRVVHPDDDQDEEQLRAQAHPAGLDRDLEEAQAQKEGAQDQVPVLARRAPAVDVPNQPQKDSRPRRGRASRRPHEDVVPLDQAIEVCLSEVKLQGRHAEQRQDVEEQEQEPHASGGRESILAVLAFKIPLDDARLEDRVVRS